MQVNGSAQAEKVLGYYQVVGVPTAIGFDSIAGGTIPEGTEFVEVFVAAESCRWRADGTPPTAAVGMPIAVGQTQVFTMQTLADVRIIDQTGPATLNVTFYGR